MARLFERTATDAVEDTGAGPGGASAVRLLAAVVTALLVSFLVVARTQAATAPATAAAGSDLAAGGVRITTDSVGRSLFNVPAMAPGRPVANCIAVTYTGTVVPAVVRLSAQADGALSRGLTVTVQEGRGGGFGDCGGFQLERSLFAGALAELARRPPLPAFQAQSPTETHTFRFTFSLDDVNVDQGAAAAVAFSWTASTR
ncbi:MAG: hypothetical protein JOZ68_19450 [Acidimicrobiia bacterium]|nr:hypothetical protein [Acidimicrobiia bacterium]MBV9043173.1 hypothetical protein [Acidimicrobiia bacterium]